MYSLLLMTAMAGSPDATAFGWRSGGCHGCFGGVAVGCGGYSSCYGGGFAGCNGYSCGGYSSCHGCRGGFLGFGLIDRWHARGASCHGCSGYSCHGGSYSAVWGSCYGSGYGGGCWGSCYGGGIGAGCHGGVACHGASVGPTWIDPIPAAPVITAPAVPAPAVPTTGGTSSQAPARLTVELPTTAKLFVDGAEVTGVGATRQFHTPDLPAGELFFYDLRAEVEVNGSVQTEEKRVVVRAGETVSASFAKLAAAVGDSGAVAVK